MVKIDLRTNVSFLVIFITVLVLAVLQGGAISKSFFGTKEVLVSDIQVIAFVILTLFILFVVTLRPDKVYLSAYSSMTLGLVVIISAFYNLFKGADGANVFQFILGLVLIVSGFLLNRKGILSKKDVYIVEKGLEHYKK